MITSQVEFAEIIDKFFENEGKQILEKEFGNQPNLEWHSEGPNIHFVDSLVDYKITVLSFKPNSSHELYSNLLGSFGAIMSFGNKARMEKSFDETGRIYLKSCIEKIREQIEKDDFHIENHPYPILRNDSWIIGLTYLDTLTDAVLLRIEREKERQKGTFKGLLS